MSDDIDFLKDEEKEKLILEDADFKVGEQAYGRVTCKSHNYWAGGLVLISIGVIFLLTNSGVFYLQNWWALFILYPAIMKLGQAIQSYRRDGRFSHRVRGAFTGGLILTVVASTFLFNWNWGSIWPLFLVIIGLGAVLSGVLD